MIQINNVYKNYGNTQVLNNINLSIQSGSIFGIIGYSGAGKSTLLRLINALESTNNGEIFIDGVDISKLKGKPLRNIRHKIGMIFQNFNLLSSRNVYRNIALPLEIIGFPKYEIKNRVSELISLVKLEGKENFYPSQLSGGQKQRVGIARALASSPSILLCDEATSALDPSNTHAILKLLKDIQKKTNITVVIITHEMDVISEICDEVAVIDKGEIVEQGKVSYVFSHPKEKITKEFVIKGFEREENDDIATISTKYQGGTFVKLYYGENSIKDALISDIALNFNIKISIIEAYLENVNGKSTGILTAYVDSKSLLKTEVIDFIKSKNIEVELIDN